MVYLKDKADFDQRIQEIQKDGLQNLLILADFDATFTKCYNKENQKNMPGFQAIENVPNLWDLLIFSDQTHPRK